MNKKELEKHIMRYNPPIFTIDRTEGFEMAREMFLRDLDKLDEPEKPSLTRKLIEDILSENKRLGELCQEKQEEPELPDIPQFVADWIEAEKADTELMWVMDLINQRGYSHDDRLRIWLNESVINQELFIRAYRYGYIVEEPKYTVSIDGILWLAKFHGEIDTYGESVIFDDEYELELTEKEIKYYDERLWAFKEEVTI